MDIQKIERHDLELVAGLFDRYRVFYQQPSDMDLARRYLKDRLENHESVVFAALTIKGDALTPVGFTQLYPNYSSVRAVKNWILNDLYVETPYRGLGIGAALIRKGMDFARGEGATFIELETATDNYAGQHLYEKLGFIKQLPDHGFYKYRLTLKT